jgi:HEAT repeat protein
LLDADIAEAETRERIRVLEDSLDRARDQVEILERGTSSEIDASELQTRTREQTIADMVVKTGPDTIPLLIQMLDNNDPRVRSWAASILGRFGEDAEEAIGALRDLVDDRSIEVRNTAGRALDSIQGR